MNKNALFVLLWVATAALAADPITLPIAGGNCGPGNNFLCQRLEDSGDTVWVWMIRQADGQYTATIYEYSYDPDTGMFPYSHTISSAPAKFPDPTKADFIATDNTDGVTYHVQMDLGSTYNVYYKGGGGRGCGGCGNRKYITGGYVTMTPQ